ncbi:hypothetical protein ACIRNI_28545 [Streptomyces sp. NPDC093546]
MRAIRLHAFGPAENITYKEVPGTTDAGARSGRRSPGPSRCPTAVGVP